MVVNKQVSDLKINRVVIAGQWNNIVIWSKVKEEYFIDTKDQN